MEIENSIKKIIYDQLSVKHYAGIETAEAMPRDMHLFDQLYADSLDMVELAMALEQEFDLVIDDVTIDGWTTVGQAIDTVMAGISNASA